MDISNNFAENAIRPFAAGQKTGCFLIPQRVAESSAVVYTLVETAKANGLDPYAYLIQLLVERPYLARTVFTLAKRFSPLYNKKAYHGRGNWCVVRFLDGHRPAGSYEA